IAFLVFKRFGWQENRNSVHFNPVVYDWLADKFFHQHEGTARGDLVNLGIDPDALENIYTQNEPNQEYTPPPATGGFGNWFDGGGKYVFLGIVFLIFIANLASNSSRNEVENSPAYEEAKPQERTDKPEKTPDNAEP
ncbi:MAG: hypothetical protein L3J05_03710, partial [Robiginitomaculum sp.]|nr:hypothetical protein [Robiginitomaculum sp.]